MLFDLRSRGRRRTVQGVYLGLAILMGGGLVLFGVGAGNGLGGLLNAFTGGGSSNAQQQVVSQAEKAALRETRLHPSDPGGWAALVQARWTTASQAPDYDTATASFTSNGKKELALTTQAWERYLQLAPSPDPNLAVLAARAYANLGNFAKEASTWEIVTGANPTDSHAFECLAVASYAASQTRKGDLATAKVLTLIPKATSTTIKQTLQGAKSSPQTAQQLAQGC